MNEHIGSFVFINLGNGLLSCKYIHVGATDGPYAETCKIDDHKNIKPDFIGVYQTIWIEGNNRTKEAELRINRMQKNSQLFTLEWFQGNPNKMTFQGEAMLYNDLLIGHFWFL